MSSKPVKDKGKRKISESADLEKHEKRVERRKRQKQRLEDAKKKLK